MTGWELDILLAETRIAEILEKLESDIGIANVVSHLVIEPIRNGTYSVSIFLDPIRKRGTP